MNHLLKGLSAALCGLFLSAQANAGALAELEALGKSAPGDFGRVYDNNTAAGDTGLSPVYTQEKVKQLMLSDLDSLRNIIAARYAPAGFKNSLNGWDLDAEIAKAREKVTSDDNITLKEYQGIVQNLFASMQDYHVSVAFHSTEYGVVPIQLTYSGGRYYIASIMRQVLPEAAFPFKPGDEIVSFGGKPIGEAVDELLAADGVHNVPDADRGLAASRLTARMGSHGQPVPQGKVALSVRPAGGADATPVTLDWIYGEEVITSPFRHKLAGGLDLPMSWLADMYVDQYALTGRPAAASAFDMGNKNGPLPDLGEKTWEAPAGSFYRAYAFKNPADGSRGGYLRIPTYMFKAADADKMVQDFARILAEFNDRTDYLVVDQLNNPGGYVFYMYSLLSMLTDRPLTTPKQRVTLTQADIAGALDFITQAKQVKTDADAKALMGETLTGYPVTLKLVRDMSDFYAQTVQQWRQGKTFTDPLAAFGVGDIAPAYGTRYAKPLMILTNEMDFSCGDFFPAIMQDNRRALTFGARTGGAGGSVKGYKYENSLLGMQSYNLTGTLAIRLNGQPIESLGVTPDIPYAVAPGDLQAGFTLYKNAVNAAAAGLN